MKSTQLLAVASACVAWVVGSGADFSTAPAIIVGDPHAILLSCCNCTHSKAAVVMKSPQLLPRPQSHCITRITAWRFLVHVMPTPALHDGGIPPLTETIADMTQHRQAFSLSDVHVTCCHYTSSLCHCVCHSRLSCKVMLRSELHSLLLLLLSIGSVSQQSSPVTHDVLRM